MKTRTKLLTAVLSTVTALSCALTAAAAGATPTLILQGNETTPAAAEDTSVTLSLKATEFGDVAGADLKLTLKGDISLDSANVTITNNTTGQSWKLEKESNYTVSGNTLKIVDVFNMKDAPTATDLDLSVVLKFNGDVNIGRYAFDCNATLVNESEQTITPAGVTMGKLVIGKKDGTAEAGEQTYDDTTKFLPYGVATDSTGKYLDKNTEGKFNFIGGENITCFIKPEGNDVTTFGASKIVDTNAIQFGSYVDDIASGATFGTLIIAPYKLPNTAKYADKVQGSYEGALNYYINKTEYNTSDKVFAYFVSLLENSGKADGKFHPLKYDTNKVIFISVIKQQNYMWRDSDTNFTKLQYAIRYKGLDDDQKATAYTAVGYYGVKSGDTTTYNFSTEVKTAKFNDLGK